MPFDQAAEMLAALTGVQVSEAAIRRQTYLARAAYEAVQAAQSAAPEDLAPPCAPTNWCSVSMERWCRGSHGQWAEVKTLVIGEVQTRQEAGVVHSTHLSYFSRMSEASVFADQASMETRRCGVAEAAQVCAVMDGAEWIDEVMDLQCPDALRILDFPHAAQAVSTIGQGAGMGEVEAHCLHLNHLSSCISAKKRGPFFQSKDFLPKGLSLMHHTPTWQACELHAAQPFFETILREALPPFLLHASSIVHQGRPVEVSHEQLWLSLLLSVLLGMNSYQDLWRTMRQPLVDGCEPIQVTDDALIKRLKRAGLQPLEETLSRLGDALAPHLASVQQRTTELAPFASRIVAVDAHHLGCGAKASGSFALPA